MSSDSNLNPPASENSRRKRHQYPPQNSGKPTLIILAGLQSEIAEQARIL
ncbi:unnamed protein product [Moneuplotes crassus]|uniref:Uncharacterized protein n=1 Tax=Euplotes crassus TaxID=5936 RepID=A0AAD1XWA2_EUPCR|nr:unnamed protein product [Moneuplotes crassus]